MCPQPPTAPHRPAPTAAILAGAAWSVPYIDPIAMTAETSDLTVFDDPPRK